MIVKLITVFVKAGRLADYLAVQRVWNRETAKCAGYMGTVVGQDVSREDVVCVQVYWRSMNDYERFMREEHDRIALMAGADAYYDRIEVRVVEWVDGDCDIVADRG